MVPEQVLLLRAMVAAALANRDLDDRERAKIQRQAGRAGLTMNALRAEVVYPWTPERLSSVCTDERLKAKVYAAAVFTVNAAPAPEHARFLQSLADALQLPTETRAKVHGKYGGESCAA